VRYSHNAAGLHVISIANGKASASQLDFQQILREKPLLARRPRDNSGAKNSFHHVWSAVGFPTDLKSGVCRVRYRIKKQA
jgi:hypothetical protein